MQYKFGATLALAGVMLFGSDALAPSHVSLPRYFARTETEAEINPLVVVYSSKCDGRYDKFELHYKNSTETYSLEKPYTKREFIAKSAFESFNIEFAECKKR